MKVKDLLPTFNYLQEIHYHITQNNPADIEVYNNLLELDIEELQQQFAEVKAQVAFDNEMAMEITILHDKQKEYARKIAAWEANRKARQENIKAEQDNCKHDKGYLTNTSDRPSTCILCGKPWI